MRRQQIVDTLVDLLLDVIYHTGTKAERRVEKDFINDIKQISGKTNILFRLAKAVADKPDGTIREVIFPVVSEQTLRDLVKEYKSTGSAYQQKVQAVMRSSYSRHYDAWYSSSSSIWSSARITRYIVPSSVRWKCSKSMWTCLALRHTFPD